MKTQDELKKIFSARIKEAAAKKGFKTQAELVEPLELSATIINYYYKGKAIPDANTLVKLSDGLEVSADYLLGLSEALSLDEKINAAEQITGLSAESVEMLSTLRKLGANEILRFLDIALKDIKNELDFALDENTKEELGGYNTEQGRLDFFLRIGLSSSLLGLLSDYYFALGQKVNVSKIYSNVKALEDYVLFDIEGKNGSRGLNAKGLYLQGLKDEIIKRLEDIKEAAE